MSKVSPALNRWSALILALLFLGGPNFLVGTMAQGGNGATASIKFTRSDYVTPLTALYGSSTVYVVLTSATSDTTAQRDFVTDVSIARGSSTQFSLDLLETGPETGVFTGSFDVSSDANSGRAPTEHVFYGKINGDGRVAVTDGDVVRATSITPAAMVEAPWRQGYTAVLSEHEDSVRSIAQGPILFGWDDVIFYKLADQDLNVNAQTAETYSELLVIRSLSDLDGESVTLTETGSNTGVFFAEVGFETSLNANNDDVYVRSGDWVQASYLDLRDAAGQTFQSTLPRRNFTSATEPSAFFARDGYAGFTQATSSSGRDRATLLVVDLEKDVAVGSEALTVELQRNGTVVCTNVPLSQLGGVAGAYYLTVGFRTPGSGPANCIDPATGIALVPTVAGASRHTITARYVGGATGNLVRTDNTTWLRTEDAQLVIGTNLATPLRRLVGTTTPVTVILRDSDSDLDPARRDSATVTVRSGADPVTGLTVTLTETAETTGVFQGSLQFTTEATGGGRLRVADGNDVVATYIDTLGVAATRTRIESNPAIWRAPTTATIELDQSAYYFADVADDTLPETRARVFVQDMDQNDPLVRDLITVRAFTGGASPTQLTLPLTEVGVNSGLFTGFVLFSNATVAGRLNVGTGTTSQFQVEYLDSVNAAGNIQLVSSATVTWNHKAPLSAARFESVVSGVPLPRDILYMPGGTGSQPYTVVVYSGTTDPGDAIIFSSTCTSARSVNLSGGEVDGRWTGTVTMRTVGAPINCPASTVDEVGVVQNGGTITLRLPPTLEYISVSRPANGGSQTRMTLPGSESTATLLVGDANSVTILSNQTSNNRHRFIREMATVSATALLGDAGLVGIEAVENSNDVIGFTTSIGLRELAASNLTQGLLDVSSELLGSATSPHSMFAVVSATGLAAADTDRVRWYDADRPMMSLVSEAAGTAGQFVVSLTLEDALSGRALAESPVVSQRTVTAAKEFVYDSELVFAQESVTIRSTCTQTGPVCTANGAPLTGSVSVGAFGDVQEPIIDADGDGFYDCDDVQVSGAGAANPAACRGISLNANGLPTGVVLIRCGTSQTDCTAAEADTTADTAVTVTSKYRMERGTSLDAYHYVRVGGRQVLLGSTTNTQTTGQPGSPGNVPISAIAMDYSPQNLTAIATSTSGDTENVVLTWDATRGTYQGGILVELTRTAGNGRIHVTSTAPDVTFRYDDPRLPDGAASSTNPGHMRAITARGVWRPAQDGVITFRSADFADVATERVFGNGVPVQVVDADADLTPDQDSVQVRVRPGSGGAAFANAVLRETGSTTGVFRGYAPVSATGSPPGSLNLGASGGGLVAAYQDARRADGTSGERTALIDWKPSTTAQIRLYGNATREGNGLADTAEIVGGASNLYVDVIDADANVDSRVFDKVRVRVTSQGDIEGESVELSETGVNTGVFRSSGVAFESALVPRNGKVFARDSALYRDFIQASYADKVDAQGRSQSIDSVRVRWNQTFDGVVNLEARYYIGTVDDLAANSPGTRPLAIVTVADGDCNANPRTVDRIAAASSSCSSASSLQFGRVGANGTLTQAIGVSELIETGANTGVFLASFTFITNGTAANETLSSSRRAQVLVSNRNPLEASYTDPTPAAGAAREFSDEAQWFQPGFGIIEFDRTGYNDFADRPILRLIDADLASLTRVALQVASGADSDGILVNLTRASPGIFEAQISLSEASSDANQIRVNEVDTIRSVYADASPSGVREATAAIGIGLVTGPTTRIVTDPAVPDGLRGAFLQPVTVNLTTNRPVADTFFHFGAGGSDQSYREPLDLGEGVHELYFHSVDLFGNAELEKNITLVVDLNAPEATVSEVIAVPAPAGAIRLTWPAPEGKGDLLEVYDYVIFRDALADAIGNTTEETFLDDNLSDEVSHSYTVAVRDFSGRTGPASNATSATPDAQVPVVSNGTASTARFDLDSPPAHGINVSVRARDAHLSLVVGEVVNPNGTVLASVEMALVAGDRYEGVIDVPGLTEPCSCAVLLRALDEAGNVGEIRLPLTVLGTDTTPPVVTAVTEEDSSVPVGGEVLLRVADNVILGSVSYHWDNFTDVTVPVSDAFPANVTIAATAGFVTGHHTLTVFATDVAAAGGPANNVTTTFDYNLVAGLFNGVPTYFLNTTAKVVGDDIKVSWEVPADLDADAIVGFQVWRSSSPWELIATLEDPTARSYTDRSVSGGNSYKYVATFFTDDGNGRLLALADLPGYPGDNAVPGTDLQEVKGGLPMWLWIVLAVILVLIIVVIILVVVSSRKSKGEKKPETPPPPPPAESLYASEASPPAAEEPLPPLEEPPPELPPEEPPMEEIVAAEPEMVKRTLKCPKCTNQFQVEGTLPLTTVCPHCGARGTLR